MAVVKAAERWAPMWQGSDVTVVTDSVVAKAVINKGTCKHAGVMQALRGLFWLQTQYNFRLHAIHMPGKLNQLPDAISRLHEPGQILRLCALLNSWHCTFAYRFGMNWVDHMSPSALQVLYPHLKRWGFMRN